MSSANAGIFASPTSRAFAIPASAPCRSPRSRALPPVASIRLPALCAASSDEPFPEVQTVPNLRDRGGRPPADRGRPLHSACRWPLPRLDFATGGSCSARCRTSGFVAPAQSIGALWCAGYPLSITAAEFRGRLCIDPLAPGARPAGSIRQLALSSIRRLRRRPRPPSRRQWNNGRWDFSQAHDQECHRVRPDTRGGTGSKEDVSPPIFSARCCSRR